MKTVLMRIKPTVRRVLTVLAALGAPAAFASGFALQEQNGSGPGNAFAGGAAIAEDASTVRSNPAGMSRFSSIAVAGSVAWIFPSAGFDDGASQPAFNEPLGGNGGNGTPAATVPALYVIVPINDDWKFGLGVSVPFGLETDWNSDWLGRYQARRSKIDTVDINPALSWRIDDRFSVGAGIDYQRLDGTFTSNANYSGALATAAQTAALQGLIPAAAVPPFVAATGGLDSSVNVSGDDWAWGWNLGVLWNLTPDTRIGVHYRSSLEYDLNGNVSFANPALPALPPPLAQIGAALVPAVDGVLANGGVEAHLKLPSITNVSFYSRIDPRWELMADAQYTNWSTIDDLTFKRTGTGTGTGTVLISTPENFEDSWRLSAGASYYLNDKWKLRSGIAYDQSPVQDAERTPRLPDSDRYWLAAGVQYAYSPSLRFDLGATYIWAADASSNIDGGNAAQFGLVDGDYDADVFLVAGQMSYVF